MKFAFDGGTMTPREFILSNQQCAINDIPFGDAIDFCSEHYDMWRDPLRNEAWERELQNHLGAMVSLRFFNGEFNGYFFNGCYTEGSASWKKDLTNPHPVIITYEELHAEETTEVIVDFDFLI